MAVTRDNGWWQFRRGLYAHLFAKVITHEEYLVFTVILGHADPATGIWQGNAEVLAQWLGLPNRTLREVLARLEVKTYIRRFHEQGKQGTYPIFIHNFECSDGAVKGLRLNAFKSKSSKDPLYEVRRDSRRESAVVLIENRKEETPRARAGLPSIPTPRTTPRPGRPSDSWMSKPVEPGENDAMMAIVAKRVAEGKPVDADSLRNLRAWELEQVKKKGPASVNSANGCSAHAR